jgi:biotin synthase
MENFFNFKSCGIHNIDQISNYNFNFERLFQVVDSYDELDQLYIKFEEDLFIQILHSASLMNRGKLTRNDKCGSFYADIRPCSEDCIFCPLSKNHYNSVDLKGIKWHEIPDKILDFAKKMDEVNVNHFKIVTTGAKSDDKIIPYIAYGVQKVKNIYPASIICISEGILNFETLKLLKLAGVDIYNNNLETSRNLYPTLVTTHTYDQKINAIKMAKELDFKICSGGIYGIGESLSERIELFQTLKEIGIDSSPFNIFVNYPNLPLTHRLRSQKYIFSKNECFLSIALFRLINPDTRLVLGAGRRDFFSEREQKFALLIGGSALASSGYFSKNGISNSIQLDDNLFNDILEDEI